MFKGCFFNRKGGVGKSTVCSNIAYAYTKIDKKVLVIDLDSQKDCSFLFGLTQEVLENYKTFDDIFGEKDDSINFNEYLVEVRENLFVMTNKDLKSVEVNMSKISRIDLFLKNRLKKLEELGFDYIFIDCSPAASKLNDSILCYIDGIFLVTELENSSVRAVANIYDNLSELYLPIELIKAVIPNRARNTKDNKEHLEALKAVFNENIICDPIPLRSKIAESQKAGLTVFEYDTEAAAYFMNVFKKVVELVG